VRLLAGCNAASIEEGKELVGRSFRIEEYLPRVYLRALDLVWRAGGSQVRPAVLCSVVAPILSLVYQSLVVGIGLSAAAVSVQRARRSGREDHAAFVLFWAIFTVWLAAGLVRGYLLARTGLGPEGALLLQAISMSLNFVMVASVLRYLHRLGDVRGRAARDAVVTAGMLVSIVALSEPWGIGFDAGTRMVTFRAGFWIGEAYYMLGLLYAVALAWVSVARRPRNEGPAFLLMMAIFATAGLIESAFGLVGALRISMVILEGDGVVWSSVPYAVYAVLLVLNNRVEDLSGRVQPAEGTPLAIAAERLQLSDREREVVALVVAGRSNRQIADELYVSVATVKTHLYRIYRKAQVPSRYGLMRAVQSTQ
jgi:DNA-binding CsgD family transcriptional regulator